jgi:predicted deoxyguanosinetriphosphate triphosphohydrolase
MSNEKMNDEEIIVFAQSQESIIEKLNYRVFKKDDDRSEGRDHLMRDYARVLYSSSFRRLQGKMQLLGIDANKFNRNRLTHSLEVAQIARSIAFNLKLKNPVVVETASLAHDIGNPPFGHYGETILNELCESCGGYEGNAQAFRILRTLEKKHHSYKGLDLTIRSLFAVTKYFQNREQNKKKFLYDEDYYFLETELHDKNIFIKKSIDAQIMDLADEIAYAAHDLEDALSSGFIGLGEMVHEFKISKKYEGAFDTMSTIAQDVQKDAMKAEKMETSEEYAIVLKKELTSKIVYILCQDIGVIDSEHGKELGYKTHKKFAEGLKKLLFKAILRKKDIQLYEKRGEKIIKGLFEVYSDNNYNKNNILLPPELRCLDDCKTRLVVDYISGMMDSFAAQEYERYFGKGSLEKIYP